MDLFIVNTKNFYFERLGPGLLPPSRRRGHDRFLSAFFVSLKYGGLGGRLGGGKPYSIISLTLIRAFPSSFLPVPLVPHPQNTSEGLSVSVFYEKRFSI